MSIRDFGGVFDVHGLIGLVAHFQPCRLFVFPGEKKSSRVKVHLSNRVQLHGGKREEKGMGNVG
jgi:hypothetical protein